MGTRTTLEAGVGPSGQPGRGPQAQQSGHLARAPELSGGLGARDPEADVATKGRKQGSAGSVLRPAGFWEAGQGPVRSADSGRVWCVPRPLHPLAHSPPPPGFGVACHLGVLTGLPCVGVAKKLLQVDGLEKDALHRDQVRPRPAPPGSLAGAQEGPLCAPGFLWVVEPPAPSELLSQPPAPEGPHVGWGLWGHWEPVQCPAQHQERGPPETAGGTRSLSGKQLEDRARVSVGAALRLRGAVGRDPAFPVGHPTAPRNVPWAEANVPTLLAGASTAESEGLGTGAGLPPAEAWAGCPPPSRPGLRPRTGRREPRSEGLARVDGAEGSSPGRAAARVVRPVSAPRLLRLGR